MYELATGIIDVWEKRLLSGLDQERMLKAPDRESAFIVLFDTDLSEIIASDKQMNIEEVFSRDMAGFKAKMNKILDDDGLLESFLFIKFDAFNAKSILKEHFLGEKPKGFKPFLFSLESFASLEKRIKKLLNPKSDGDLVGERTGNAYVGDLSEQSLLMLEEAGEKTSQTIEEAVDRAYFKIKLTMAKKKKALLEMVKLEIDLANLRIFLAKSKKGFLKGGNLTKSQITGIAKGEEEDLSFNLKKFLEGLELAFLLEGMEGPDLEIKAERKLDSFMAHKIFQKEKEAGSGVEKVLAFFQKKLNGYSNIRLILFAKENALELEEIKDVLLPI